ncbi:MAG: hypothetical protein J7L90_02235 [Dehalococcoidia bacterium]|nr:hypothetical protein [Dehalococcoidia bacterium]
MPKIKLRLQEIGDARRFYEILSNPNFIYFNAALASVEDEEIWLKHNLERRQNNIEWNYTILFNGELVGARVEIVMQPANQASEKVVLKNNYLKEGLLKKIFREKDGKMKDCYLYAKIL